MIHYHSIDMNPIESMIRVLSGKHGIASFFYETTGTKHMGVAMDVCQSFCLDSGAYTAWTKGVALDFGEYYQWVHEIRTHPGFDWAIIPDKIDGTEEENDHLAYQWPGMRHESVPVWHMHESLDRLKRLALEWPRVALGSSGDYKTPGADHWWKRMAAAMHMICPGGRPLCKLHGLRMLNPEIVTRLPLASADSSYVARHLGDRYVGANGKILPFEKAARGLLMIDRIEAFNSPALWNHTAEQLPLEIGI